MPRGYISERLLAQFTPRNRAAAIVGDLLEVHRSRVGFVLAVAQTMLALSWRFGLGYLFAVPVEFCIFFFVRPWIESHPPHAIDRFAEASAWLFDLLIAGSMFSLVRFGASDEITAISTAFAIVTGANLCFWWVPIMRPAAQVLAALVVALSLRTRHGREALRRLAEAIPLGLIPLVTMLYWFDRATRTRCRTYCNLDVCDAPIILLIPLAFLISSSAIAVILGRHKPGTAPVRSG